VDKKGKEFYQITLGGNNNIRGDTKHKPAIGKVLGKAFPADEIPKVIDCVLTTYLQHRIEEEDFLATYERIGMPVFKEHVYA